MKKQLKTAFAAALALMMALALVPFSALPRSEAKAEAAPTWTVPDGYDEHDYNKIVAFLEQTDENGVKNGTKLSETYDPNDPNTWNPSEGDPYFLWDYSQVIYKVRVFLAAEKGLCGSLDLSDCTKLESLMCSNNNLTELDLSGCTALMELWCLGNNLAELDVTQNTALKELACGDNNFTELDVTQNTALEVLRCRNSKLTELDVSKNIALLQLDCRNSNLTVLDVSNNTALESLSCSHNNFTELDVSKNTALKSLSCLKSNLTELDLSNNPNLCYDYIRAEGGGYLGYVSSEKAVYAHPIEGATFEGFYDENGALISEGELSSAEGYVYRVFGYGTPTGTIIARFSGGAAPTSAPSDAPVNPTDAPVNPTDAPANPSEAPVNPSDAPADPTAAPTAAPNPPATGTVALAGAGIAAIIGGLGVAVARRKRER